jgi:hypothetical protein
MKDYSSKATLAVTTPSLNNFQPDSLFSIWDRKTDLLGNELLRLNEYTLRR